jgi:hypothetical protein
VIVAEPRLTCPECGERAGVPIVWGLVPPDEMDRTDVWFGGCAVPVERFDTGCRECGHTWRSQPDPLSWPDPRRHADGALVAIEGTVGRVVLDSTATGGAWADFELVVDERLPRLRCLAFPTSFASLDVALEPGLEVGVRGRLSRAQGPELHVTGWTILDSTP